MSPSFSAASKPCPTRACQSTQCFATRPPACRSPAGAMAGSAPCLFWPGTRKRTVACCLESAACRSVPGAGLTLLIRPPLLLLRRQSSRRRRARTASSTHRRTLRLPRRPLPRLLRTIPPMLPKKTWPPQARLPSQRCVQGGRPLDGSSLSLGPVDISQPHPVNHCCGVGSGVLL